MIGRHHATLGLLAIRIAIAAVLSALFAVAVQANEPRAMRGVALIIGNGAYEHLTPLDNPDADAGAIEKLFDDLGFETDDATDADLRKLRRAIDRFIEDAEGVDVALVYYAGHGVEAGGENYLVPVDADVSSLDDAAENLVPLSDILRRLRKVAPLSFVLLDACRDNPFPPGSVIRSAPGAEALPVSASGLGETRTMKQFGQAGASAKPAAVNDSLGTLIGFAAEPGQRALDGDPGGNSPYAAAILRHVPAMAGEEISTVMRMVAEEVYLKTDGRQRPWVNENLRRLVYLGAAPPEVEGPEGDILRERRQLLVNISALPSAERRQIEAVARDGGVTMDSVYGMLRALGDDAPANPEELKNLLRDQIATIRKLESERAAISATDPEIARLTSLADQATSEGALSTAIELHEQAKARVEEISHAVDDAEADIRERRLEFGEVYARSARANFAAFKYEQAAADYQKAFDEVERWDDFSAWSYRGNQATALMESGWKGGATDNLRRAAELAPQIIALSEKLADRSNWAISQGFLGNVLMTLGQRTNDQTMIASAIEAYEAALTVFTQELYPAEYNLVTENLIGATKQVAQRYEPAKAKVELRKSVDMFDELLSSVDRAADPLRWASLAARQGAAMNDLARIDGDQALLRETIALLGEAKAIYEPTNDPNRAEVMSLLGSAWSDLGVAAKDRAALEKADALFQRSIELTDKSLAPVNYSDRLANRSLNLHNLFLQTNDPVWLEKAIGLMREGRDMVDPDALPIEWRSATTSLGGALNDLGRARKQAEPIAESVELYAAALKFFDPAKEPAEWADNLSRLADSRRNLGEIEPSKSTFEQVLDEHEQALRAVPADRFPDTVAEIRKRASWIATATSRVGDKLPEDQALALLRRGAAILDRPASDGPLAAVRAELGRRLYIKAVRTDDAAVLKEAIVNDRRALVVEIKHPDFDAWRSTQSNLGLALSELARIENDTAPLREAIGPTREAIVSAADATEAALDRDRLARIYDRLAETSDPADLRAAADAWRDAFDHLPAGATPAEKSGARENLAIALTNLAASSPDDAPSAGPEAISHYRAVLASLPPSGADDNRDRNSRNLALALQQEGQRAADPALIRQAADLYGELSGPGRAAGPQHVADRLAQAEALQAAARLIHDQPSYAAAAAAYQAVLGNSTEAGASDHSWFYFVNFADALRESGYFGQDPAPIRRSIALSQAMLGWPADRLPPENADDVRLNLASGNLYLGDLVGDPAALAAAIDQFGRLAQADFIKSSPQNAAWLDERLATSHLIRAELANDPADWRDGVSYMRKVSAAAGVADAATVARNSGNLAFGIAGAVRSGVSPPNAIAEALPLAATAVAAAQDLPDDLPFALYAQCFAQIEDGRIGNNRNTVETAIAQCRRAADAIRPSSRHNAERMLETVAYAEGLLKKM